MSINVFVRSAATGKSLSNRRLVFGIGTNDAWYATSYIDEVTNKVIVCPYYQKWLSMFKRCYSSKVHAIRPSYKNCMVSKEWLLFSNFLEWAEKQGDWRDCHLDKDLKFIGNKTYSSKYCMKLPHRLNTFMIDRFNDRGEYKQGVHFDKRENLFKAQYNDINGNRRSAGLHSCENDAFLAYKEGKMLVAVELGLLNPQFSGYLINYVNSI